MFIALDDATDPETVVVGDDPVDEEPTGEDGKDDGEPHEDNGHSFSSLRYVGI